VFDLIYGSFELRFFAGFFEILQLPGAIELLFDALMTFLMVVGSHKFVYTYFTVERTQSYSLEFKFRVDPNAVRLDGFLNESFEFASGCWPPTRQLI